jgi:preprotein translocase subunit SecF
MQDDPFIMTQERSRTLGRVLMVVAALQFVLFFAGAVRRSYLVIAIPMGIAVGTVSGVLMWIGYTMVVKDWDDPEDYPPAVSEGAPPPDALG